MAEASELVCMNINTLFSKIRITLKSTAYRLTALKGIIRFFESGRMAAEVDISTCGFRLTSLNEIVCEVPSVYQMEPGLEQISAVMLGGDSVEIKASVTMDVLVLNQVCGQVILNVREEPLDTERLKQIPGIVGYVVQPGDSLWKIARKFHTSVDAVMVDNGLTDLSIQPGDKLIIVKAVGERA